MVFIYPQYATQVLEQTSLRKLLESCIRYLRLSIVFVCVISYYLTMQFLSRDLPTISIDNFHVSSLNTTSNSLVNTTTIYLDLKFQNENSWVGIYYEDPLNLTITYVPPTESTDDDFTIGKQTIQGFYQGKGKVKVIQASVVVEDLFSMDDQQRRKLGETIISSASQAKVVDFKVYLDAKIKFKSIEGKKSDLMLGSAVEVNEKTGDSVVNKTIQLNYISGSNKWEAGKWMLFLPLFISFMVAIAIAVLLILLFVLFFLC